MAWSLVGVGTVVETATTTLTLVEPAGVTTGDLLIACISLRHTVTTSPTATGWTEAAKTPATPNTATNTSAAALGWMGYIVRGASAPSLAFTLPATPSIALGRIIAYRGNALTTPLDNTKTVSMASGSSTVMIANFPSTAQANELCVVMFAGGQEATWSGVVNDNAPILTTSGTTDTTTAPSTTAWIERADSVTTTGADTSLGIFDAVLSAASTALGNITATPSLNAASSGVAASFKIAATTNAWNKDDKSTNVTLSNNDKTATLSTSLNGGIRSTTKRLNGTAGKYYAELLTVSGVAYQFGVKSGAETLTGTANAASVAGNTASILLNGSAIGSIGSAATAGDILCMAWDAGSERIWFRKNSDNWNNDASANPATGTNGFDISAIANVDCNLWLNFFATSGHSATVRTEAAEFTQTPPNGFLSWMGEALPTSDAWNVNDKSAGISLSSSDRAATASGATQGVRSSRSNLNGTAGKYYAEFLCNSAVGQIGIVPTSQSLTSTANSFHISGTSIIVNGSSVGTFSSAALVTNDVLSVAWDAGGEKVWFRKNSGLWNNTAGHNPATDVGGIDCSFAASAAHSLWLLSAASDVVTIRTTLATFTRGIPSNFSSWMGEPSTISVSVNVIGQSVTVSIGTATATAVTSYANADVTGQSITAYVNPVLVSNIRNVSADASGQQIAVSVGTATATGKATVTVVGQALAAAIGDATATGKATANVTGQVLTAAVGDTTATGKAIVTVEGQSIATSVDAATATVPIYERQYAIGGMSGGGYVYEVGSESYAVFGNYIVETCTAPAGGANVSVNVSGQYLASEVGTATVTAIQIVSTTVTGQQLAASVGTAIATGKANASVLGQQFPVQVGTPTATAGASITVGGQVLAAAVGISNSAVATSVTVSDQAVISAVGTATATGKANTTLAGQSLTSSVGTATVTAIGNVSTSVVGQAVTSAVGTATVSLPKQAPVTGQSLPVAVGTVTVSLPKQVTAAGQVLAAAVGTTTVSLPKQAAITGQAVVPAVGDATATGTALIDVQGQEIAVDNGGVSVTAGGAVSVNVPGQQVAVELDTVNVTANQSISATVTGQTITTAAGIASVIAGVSISANVTGQFVTAIWGTVTVTISASGHVIANAAGQQVAVSLGTVTVTTKRSVSTMLAGQEITVSLVPVSVSAGVQAIDTTDVWTGTEWSQKSFKVWNGSAWMAKPMKTWNGSVWI